MKINLKLIGATESRILCKAINKSLVSLFCLIILLISHFFLKAQQPTFKNYTNVDGLPSNEIYMILQDHNGYMWMATNYGVSRFDGYRFENFTTTDGLTDNTVYELYEDFKGRIWFITSNLKLSYFENNKIHAYKFNNKIAETLEWIPYIENRCFYIDSLENLYFSVFEKGIFVISKEGKIEKLSDELIKNKILALLPISQEKYLLHRMTSVSDSIYYKINNRWNSILNQETGKLNYVNSFVCFINDKKIYFAQDKAIYIISDTITEHFILPDFIISLDEDISGNIWIGLRNNGALCFKNGDLKNSPFLHVLKGKPVTKIFSDNEGGLWFTTTTNGVYYTPSLSILNYTTDEGLVSNQIKNISNSNGNELFVCTENHYYNIIKNGQVRRVSENISKDERVMFVLSKFNKRWIGTNKQLYVNENGITKSIIEKAKIPQDNKAKILNATSVFPVDSNLTYVSYMSKICKILKNEVTSYTSLFSLSGFTNVCSTGDGKLFFGSKIGPGVITNDKMKMLFEDFPELKIKNCFIMFNNDDNSLWIATKDNGIYILKENKVKKIDVHDGLSSNYVKHLFINKNQIWASTNTGINLIFKENPEDTAYKIKIINSSLGLISNEINMISLSGENIYAATDNGLSFFNPNEINYVFNNKKSVIISRIQINEKDTLLNKSYNLPYNIASIIISYKYLSFQNAGKHSYLYRLKGLSDKWQLTKSTEIRYTTLPPGEYIFEIRHISPDNVPSENIERITFVINNPFWETWWFISLILLLFLFTLYAIYKYRISIITRQNKLKFQLIEYQSKALSSQINPHFIFNSLNSIQLYVLNNDIVKSNKYLTKFSKLMRSVLDNSQESSISLENEINTLTNYIEIEQMRFDNKFEYEIKTDPKLDVKNIKIPTLLIQPFVENSIWHGFMNKEGKGYLTIHLIDNYSTLICIIQDNGIGRKKSAEINVKKSKTHKSLGAQITQERINLLNIQFKNKLEIVTTDTIDAFGTPQGTKVEIIIPKITK